MLTGRNWFNPNNLNLVLQAGSQDAQAQDELFQIKEALKLSGWTIPMSQRAAVVSTAADVWAAYTDVTVGAEGAGGGAWFVAQPPAIFRGSSTVQLLFSMNDATSPRNTISIRVLRNGSYALPGVANTLPVASGGSNVTVHGGSLITAFAAATAIDARLAVVHSDRGDCFVFFRGAGDAGARQMFAVYANDDASGGGFGGHRYFIGALGNLTTNQMTWANLQNGSNVLSFTGDGVTALGTGHLLSIAGLLGNWPSGAEVIGGIPASPIEMAVNSATANQNRHLGNMVDIAAFPSGAAGITNLVQDFDTNLAQPKRLRGCGVWGLPVDRAVTFP